MCVCVFWDWFISPRRVWFMVYVFKLHVNIPNLNIGTGSAQTHETLYTLFRSVIFFVLELLGKEVTNEQKNLFIEVNRSCLVIKYAVASKINMLQFGLSFSLLFLLYVYRFHTDFMLTQKLESITFVMCLD